MSQEIYFENSNLPILFWIDKEGRVIDNPVRVVKDTPLYLMVEDLPFDVVKVKIQIAGKKNSKEELLKGNEEYASFGRVNFFKFQFLKSSYNESLRIHESWVLSFEMYDANNNIICYPIFSSGIIVLSHKNQLQTPLTYEISQLIPIQGETGVYHKVVLLGDFDSNEALEVFVDNVSTPFVIQNKGTIVICDLFSKTSRTIDIYIKVKEKEKEKESNHLSFYFFDCEKKN
jgi:hypothetical protein